jgi:hypothetical protein
MSFRNAGATRKNATEGAFCWDKLDRPPKHLAQQRHDLSPFAQLSPYLGLLRVTRPPPIGRVSLIDFFIEGDLTIYLSTVYVLLL